MAEDQVLALTELIQFWQEHLLAYPDCTWIRVDREDLDTVIAGVVALEKERRDRRKVGR